MVCYIVTQCGVALQALISGRARARETRPLTAWRTKRQSSHCKPQDALVHRVDATDESNASDIQVCFRFVAASAVHATSCLFWHGAAIGKMRLEDGRLEDEVKGRIDGVRRSPHFLTSHLLTFSPIIPLFFLSRLVGVHYLGSYRDRRGGS